MKCHTTIKIIKSHTVSFSSTNRHSSMCKWLKLFSLWFSFGMIWANIIEIVSLKSFLSVSMSQYHLVLFNILNLCIFRNTLLVVYIIFLNRLHSLNDTWGKNGGLIFFCSSLCQSILLKKGWNFTSCRPLVPNLFYGFLWISLLTKSTLSLDHPYGGI